MEQQTKKNLIFGGSIAAAVLIGLGAGLGIGFGVSGSSGDAGNSINTEYAANTKGIGAFSNLDSFDNDGFNYGVRQAAVEYTGAQGDNAGFDDQFTYETKTSQYSNSGMEYVPMLQEYYSTNDILISAGFQVGGAITGDDDAVDADGNPIPPFGGVFTDLDGNDTIYGNSDEKAFVLLDDSGLSTTYNNAASISFAAEGAGYMAGIASAAYTEYDAKTNHADDVDYTPNIVMWGGLPFPTVYDFMSGFEQSVNEYNTARGTDIVIWSGGISDEDSVGDEEFNVSGQTDSAHWYSGGFDADEGKDNGKVAKVKTLNAISSSASVIFPVAGGNAAIVESNLAAATDTTTRIMGVDADATLSASHPELFLGTAEKNLTLGGEYGLWAMDDFNGNGIRNIEEAKALGSAETYIEFNPTDTFFIENSDNIVEWHADGVASLGATPEVGAQFRGDVANGGVGLLVGGANGGSTDLVVAFQDLSGDTTITADLISDLISDYAKDQPIVANSATFTDV